jgi:hypothetical protein
MKTRGTLSNFIKLTFRRVLFNLTWSFRELAFRGGSEVLVHKKLPGLRRRQDGGLEAGQVCAPYSQQAAES